MDDDGNFTKWIEKLRSIAEINSNSIDHELEDFIKLIENYIENEATKLPNWLGNTKITSIRQFSSNHEDMMLNLRHISLPNALAAYKLFEEHIKPKFEKQPSSSSNNIDLICNNIQNSKTTLSIGINALSTKSSHSKHDITKFFKSLSKGEGSEVTALCQLADVSYRLNRAIRRDRNLIGNIMSSESKRQQMSMTQLSQRQKRIELLQDTKSDILADHESIINSCLTAMESELKVRTVALTEAENEEEIAKKVYEMAIEKRKNAAEKVEILENTLTVSAEQRQKLLQVDIKRLEVDNYNITSAAGRIELFKKFQYHIQRIEDNIVQGKVNKEVQNMFSDLTTTFMKSLVGHSNDEDSLTEEAETTIFIAAQLGFETIKLWKQLNFASENIAIPECISSFEQLLTDIKAKLLSRPHSRSFPRRTMMRGDIKHQDSATVVLYFDHAIHDTPPHHVECQDRVNTCLESIRTMLQLSHKSDERDFKKQANRLRSIQLVSCNDILSPPLWVLPLVHSPNYLDKLYTLSQEAKEEDLLVPLEFDTEWESDVGLSDSSDDETLSSSTNLKLYPIISLPETIVKGVGQEIASQFTQALRPYPGDATVAKMLADLEKGNDGRRTRRSRRRLSDLEAIQGSKIGMSRLAATAPIISSNKARRAQLSINSKVKTPYGHAIVKSIGTDEKSSVRVLFLGHKATGYLQKEVCQVLPKAEEITELPASRVQEILAEERNRLLSHDFRNGKLQIKRQVTPDGRFQSTCPFIHRIMIKFIAEVGMQKPLAEAMGIQYATLSLWIHGRTSQGLSRLTEAQIAEWIQYFDDGNLLGFYYSSIDPTTELGSSRKSRNSRAKVLGRKSVPESSSEDEDERLGEEEEGDDNDDEDMDEEENLPNKRRANNTRNRPRPPEFEEGSRWYSSYAATDYPQTTPVGDSPKIVEEDQVRKLMKRVMKETSASQGVLAQIFMDDYNEHSTQGKMSSWFLYKLKEPFHSSHRECGLKWVRANAEHLSDSEKLLLEKLEAWQAQLTAAKLDKISGSSKEHLKRKGRKPVMTTHHSGTEGDEYDDSDNSAKKLVSNNKNGSKKKSNDEKEDRDSEVSSDSDLMSIDEAEPGSVKIESSASSNPIEGSTNSPFIPSFDLPKHDLIEAFIHAPKKNVTVPDTDEDHDKCGLEDIDEMAESTSVSIPDKSLNNMVPETESHQFISASTDSSSSTVLLSSNYVVQSTVESKHVISSTLLKPKWDLESIAVFTTQNVTTDIIEQLCVELRKEMQRRNMEPSDVSKEGDLFNWGRGEEAIKTFLIMCSVECTNQAIQFYNLILRWIRMSKAKYKDNLNTSSRSFPILPKPTAHSQAPVKEHNQSHHRSSDNLAEGIPRAALADTYNEGFHYGICDHCRQLLIAGSGIATVSCACCPCVYHIDCLKQASESFGDPTKTTWFCWKCIETSACTAQEITSEEKKDTSNWEGKWLLIYAHSLRRWRACVVIGTSQQPGIFQVKWWRIDNRGGKSQWINVSKARILSISSPVGSEGKTKIVKRNRQNTRNESDNEVLEEEDGEDGEIDYLQRRKRRRRSESVPQLDNVEKDKLDGLKDGIKRTRQSIVEEGGSDTYISSESVQAALCAAGSACRAVDIALCSSNTNVFACTRPPGHHAGRYGCTAGCLSTGFCLLNNAAIAVTYSRVRWGLERVAVVDIDVHFGNGTAEILRHDPRAFFASVHMIYGSENKGMDADDACCRTRTKKTETTGFYPVELGRREVSDTFVSVGVFPAHEPAKRPLARKRSSRKPEDTDGDADLDAASGSPHGTHDREEDDARVLQGPAGYRSALADIIIPRLRAYRPQILVISAGFDGFFSDPLGGALDLSVDDYAWATKQLMAAVEGQGDCPVVSLLEGGYDVSADTLGLARCVVSHVSALREGPD